jgi:transposase
LERCPFPDDVVVMKISFLQELIAKSSRKKAGSAQKAKALYQAAQKSIGLKRVGGADRFRVKICLEEVKRTVLMLEDIDRQIVKYAGYDTQESDSGSWVSRKFISKKGRWPLRKYLFFMSMRVVVLSKYFQNYYQRKLATKNRVG